MEIFNEFDKAVDGGSIIDRTMYDHCKAILADKLELPQRDIILPFIRDLFTDLSKRVDELESSFKKHRHQMDKPYSEKPAW